MINQFVTDVTVLSTMNQLTFINSIPMSLILNRLNPSTHPLASPHLPGPGHRIQVPDAPERLLARGPRVPGAARQVTVGVDDVPTTQALLGNWIQWIGR